MFEGIVLGVAIAFFALGGGALLVSTVWIMVIAGEQYRAADPRR